MQLSQTPLQRAVKSSTNHLEQHTTNVVSPFSESFRQGDQSPIVGAPTISKDDCHILSSSMSLSTGVVKVSNSDDEDLIDPEGEIYHENRIDEPNAPHKVPHKEIRVNAALLTVPSAKCPVPTFVPGLTVAKRQNTASFYRYPYTPVEDPRDMNLDGPGFSHPHDESGQFGTQSPRTAYPIVTVASDELDAYVHRTASFRLQGHGAPLRHASTPVHLPDHPPQLTNPVFQHEYLNYQYVPATLAPESCSPSMGSGHASQPPPQTQVMPPPTNVDGRASQQAKQTASGVQEPSALLSSFGVLVPGRASLEGAEGQKKVPIPRAPTQTLPSKRVKVSSKTQTVFADRDGFGPKPIDILDFKYRTYKCINMPARTDVTPGEQPPEPAPDSHPYDESIDYRASYLIWLSDDLELAYSETLRRYKAQFQDERTITEDTVRKRHILYLEKLARKYGLKPAEEIKKPGGRVATRGKQVGHQYNTVNGVHVYSADAGHDLAGKPRKARAGKEPTKHRGFLKACICVWRDTIGASFEEIKLRLEKDYGWNIGANTVKKHYYDQRGQVYDTYNVTGAVDHETFTRNADEDLDQLKLHFQQRQAYLLRTYVQDVPAEDIAYMEQLEQLISRKEQDQLQRVQQMGSSDSHDRGG